jgi:ornithine carbamoyltransferase
MPSVSDQPAAVPPDADPALSLVERARTLLARAGEPGFAPLKGRHVAIAAAAHDAPSARSFEKAATALGARVSHIGPEALVLDDTRLEATARILGSLYDAIDFIPMPAERASTLQRLAGVPVFADLGGEQSPLRALAATSMDAAGSEAWIVALIEAVLVRAVG